MLTNDWTSFGVKCKNVVYMRSRLQHKLIALAKTGMVCYDYEKKKVIEVPASVALLFEECKK